jgi:hypothetical protein
VVWWLPNQILRQIFQPVTAMLDSLAENTEAEVKKYKEEHGF